MAIIEIQGFYKNQRMVDASSDSTKNIVLACDRLKLDELNVHLNIKTKSEMDQIIKMMQYVRNSLEE